ncbi:HupE/UreJ family protein [Phaeovibrio sulfidiphilus]|uniref:HupE/UreJ family protein n=1 Tax=Phaeovibrio sulfidiphilus TaxID=1220600 RepID=A0A8J6YV78_9PROT|nr:HupE/UreJ family protein [Phaeovibrio sulfidiphilus]MBE1236357.1 HupE/UreJ family protein [Phaeovibrio sulfidiphilus]
MVRRISGLGATALAVALWPQVALAHTGFGSTSGFAHGFLHPVSGLDHLLAMVMVGILAWQLGGRALWALPVTFVGVMALGGALGMAGVSVPFVEVGIALSVVVLGLAVAFRVGVPLAGLLSLVAVFAVFHGHAHGAEMPETVAGYAYGLGFLVATMLLHLAGISLGFLIGRVGEAHGAFAVRSAGAIGAAAGLVILGQALF